MYGGFFEEVESWCYWSGLGLRLGFGFSDIGMGDNKVVVEWFVSVMDSLVLFGELM